MRTRRGLLGLLAGGALALLAGRWIAGQYADFAFHRALGLTELWETRALLTLGLAAGAFLWVTGFAFANLFAVRQSIVSLVLPRQLGGLEIAEAVPTRRLTVLAAALAVGLGTVFALLPHDWAAAALALEPLSFGEFDPYLERDLGFFVAWLPWERALQERILAAVIAVGATVVLGYAATPSIRWTDAGLYVSTWVRRHFSVLAGLLVLLVGWDWRLDRYERLSDGIGTWLAGEAAAVFSAFDHRIALPYLAAASFAAVPIAAVLTWAGWRGYLRLALTMLSAMIVGGPVASVVLPLAARRPLATADAAARDRPYRNIAALYTRRAFGVDAIGGADTLALGTVSAAALHSAVSGWDPAALAPHGLAGARAHEAAGLGWRATAGGLEAVVLHRPGADTPASLRVAAAAFAAARADDSGLPFAGAGLRDARLDGVLVAPGAGAYALVADTTGRIAAPEFGTTLSRIALSWDLQDPRLLLREPPSPRPRLVSARDVHERVRRLVPFLTLGTGATPIVRGDSLYWVVELFVTAERYPLSLAQPVGGREVRYARHAATAVVQAQTGAVQLIVSDRPDPLTRHWANRFRSAFTTFSAAPEWVRAERPPLVDEMLIQGTALATVGFQGDSIGRSRLTRADDADADVAEGPPTFFQLDTGGALGWALPMDVPWAGTTLGILVARGGNERRTEFHRAPGPRWTTVLDELQLRADSAGFGRSLPGSRRGRVQAIPTDAGPAWVQSHYVWPADGLPRLAGVVVMVGGRARVGRTLPEALGVRPPPRAAGDDAFRDRVRRLYEAMEAAMRAGDWQAYGEAWAALGRLVDRP